MASIRVATSNGYFFNNASNNDICFFTNSNASQQILFGSTSNVLAPLTISNSNISISGDLNFGGILKKNGVPYVGSQWSNNLSNVFLMTSNVGIGKMYPTYPLDIAGDLNFDGILRKGGVPYVGSQWSNNFSNVFLMSCNIGIGTMSPMYPLDVTGDINFGGILRKSGIPYVGSQWSNNSNNVFLIGSNVGINKVTPAYPLDVAGDLNFDGILRKGGVPYVGSQWSNNLSNVFLMTSNVGIGKMYPTYPLDVAGDLNFDGILRKGGVPYVGSQWSNNSNNVFLMSSNIGIGTSNPLNILSINSTPNNSNVTISMMNLSNNTLKIGVNDYVNGNSFIQSDCNLVLSSKYYVSVSNILTTSNSPSNYLNLFYATQVTTSNLTPLSNWGGYLQTTASQKPIYYSSNGYCNLPYVSFLGNSLSNNLSTTNQSYNMNTNGGFTLISFMRFNSNQAFPRIFSATNPGYMEVTQNGNTLQFYMNGPANFYINTGNVITVGEWNVYTFRLNASTGATSIYQNMTSLASGTTPYTSNVTSALTYIAKSPNGDPYMQADIGYMAIYDSFISDATLSNMLMNIYNPTTTTTSYNNLVVSASNVYTYNNVGIGTSNPQSQLDIIGTTTMRGDLQINNAVAIKGLTIMKRDGTMANITTSSVTGFSNTSNGVLISMLSNTSSNSFVFMASNTTIATLNGTGNLYLGSNVGPGYSNYPTDLSGNTGNIITSGNICAGNLGMFRNRIINGDMRINQRGIKSLTLPLNANTYTIDRFVCYTAGTGVCAMSSVTLVNTDAPYQYGHRTSLKNAITTAYGTSIANYHIPSQVIEGNNIQDFNWGQSFGQSVTVSFWSRTSGITSLPVTVRNSAATYSYNANVAVASNGTWQYNTVTIPAPPIGSIGTWDEIGMNLFIGGIQFGRSGLASTTGWVAANSIGTTASTPWITTIGNYIEFTGLQLEKGTIATPFEFRPYHTELQLCQRYYYVISNSVGSGASPVGMLMWGGGIFDMYVTAPVTMRSAPTSMNISALSTFQTYVGVSPSAPTQIILSDCSPNLFRVIVYFTTITVAAGGCVPLRFIAAGGYMGFSAEL